MLVFVIRQSFQVACVNITKDTLKVIDKCQGIFRLVLNISATIRTTKKTFQKRDDYKNKLYGESKQNVFIGLCNIYAQITEAIKIKSNISLDCGKAKEVVRKNLYIGLLLISLSQVKKCKEV